MRRRKERIRKGLEIDFDLIDSDVMRWHFRHDVKWTDGPTPQLLWARYHGREDWVEGDEMVVEYVIRTLDNPTELAEGRRMIRLLRYKSFACVADLAARPREKGEFVIRTPPILGVPQYVTEVDDQDRPATALADADRPGFYDDVSTCYQSEAIEDAQRFTHAEAVRLAIRFLLESGSDVPQDHGDYWEPIRYDVAEELHHRALSRPHLSSHLQAVLLDLSREPS